MTRKLSRREFGALVGGVAVVGIADGSDTTVPSGVVTGRGVVGVARIEGETTGRLDEAAVEAAMSAALKAATGADNEVLAVRSLFSSTDVVGIKLNCLGGKRLSPRPELVNALVDHLIAGGVVPRNIILFERSSRELERAGFEISRSGDGPRCFGTDNDYDRQPSISGSIGSCFARLVSERCSALIGFGVVKDHDLAGVSASLKNWYGVIHNPNKYHDNQCDPYVADVVRHPLIRDKLKLTVLDGVTAQCHGGPAYRASGIFPLGRLVASTDPVAADLWAWRVIDEERTRRGMPTLEAAGRQPRFISTAASHGLGVGDPSQLIEVEV